MHPRAQPRLRRDALRWLLAAAVSPLLAGAARASAPALPPVVMQKAADLRPLGASRLVVLGFNIYDAKLWVREGFSADKYDAELFALELRYLRNFSGSMIAERSIKEMRRLGTVTDEQAQKWLGWMRQAFPDVKKGDQLIGVHRPDGSASFALNGKNIGEIRDETFTQLFFAIWLSPRTSEPKMRAELLGAASARTAAR